MVKLSMTGGTKAQYWLWLSSNSHWGNLFLKVTATEGSYSLSYRPGVFFRFLERSALSVHKATFQTKVAPDLIPWLLQYTNGNLQGLAGQILLPSPPTVSSFSSLKVTMASPPFLPSHLPTSLPLSTPHLWFSLLQHPLPTKTMALMWSLAGLRCHHLPHLSISLWYQSRQVLWHTNYLWEKSELFLLHFFLTWNKVLLFL